MRLTLLKSKLHRAIVTDTELEYEGSCAIDEKIMESADILEYEMLHIYNLNNGKRFTTYAIKAEKNSGIISFNGAAAYQAEKNDLVIICTFTELEKNELVQHKPKLVYFKKNTNKIDLIRSNIPTQKKNIKVVKF